MHWFGEAQLLDGQNKSEKEERKSTATAIAIALALWKSMTFIISCVRDYKLQIPLRSSFP